MSWNEHFPVRTTSNPGIEQVYEGFPITLNWNYSLTRWKQTTLVHHRIVMNSSSCLSLGVIKFNSDGIVSIRTDDSADPVNAKFQNRLSVSSTNKRASLFNIET